MNGRTLRKGEEGAVPEGVAVAVAQLLLNCGCVVAKGSWNAFDINTSVHSFHLSCVIIVLLDLFVVLPECHCLRKLMVRTCRNYPADLIRIRNPQFVLLGGVYLFPLTVYVARIVATLCCNFVLFTAVYLFVFFSITNRFL